MKLLSEVVETTLGQERSGMAFNATEGTTDDFSVTEYIVRYTERATSAEGKM